ncbi:MAG: hypothetical protein ABR574_01205 [Cryomorphaceae bacterium]|nr:hypothetical protein [Flavobacteriales bacterium]
MKTIVITVTGDDDTLLKKVKEFAARLGLQVQFRRSMNDWPDNKKPEDRKEALEAMKSLAKLKPFGDIVDPVSWQKEQRKDRRP